MARACSSRAVIQIFLTGLTIGTAILAFIFAFIFENHIDQLSDNFRGQPETANLPCVRAPLEACDEGKEDRCFDYCCPVGYLCSRSPIVGLYCQEGQVTCGDHNWCRDFADIPNTCSTEVCQNHEMVRRITSWSYVLAAIGIVLDLVDVITIFTLPDFVTLKSGVNIGSSLAKWIAFGLIIGAGTQGFMSELEAAQCYNSDGMDLVKAARSLFLSYSVMEVASSILSIVLAPFSAYYGGKLTGVPYVK
mmetsp:Transcript_64044/g.152739  ORF Transcript_64044/g.152739 Transcript_64044/m.152739 type:complete len:248 (-) Transcript_64044:94-837(-)